jgi:protein TonB
VLLHVAAYSTMWLASGSIEVPETAISAQLIADVQSLAVEKSPPAPDAEPQLEPPTPTRYVVTQPEPPKPARYVKPSPAPLPAPVATAAPIQTSIPVETPLPIETPPPIEAPLPKADAKPLVVAKVEPPAPAPVTRGPEAVPPPAAAAAPAALAAAPMSNAPAAAGPLAPADAPAAPAGSEALGTGHGAGGGGAASSGALIAALPVTQSATPRGGYQIKPTYPSGARRAGIQGTTLLGVFVGADGRVADVVVKQSAGHPDLDRAATEAVRRWRFEPARRGAEAVAMWVELPVEFHLR